MKNIIKNSVLNLFGRKRLLFWLSKDSTIEETFLYNLAAKTFDSIGDPKWQVLVLSNMTKINMAISVQYYRNFVENGNHFHSQLGQDCLVDTILRQKTNGVFVEIGVGNGKDLSNTYFFEKQRGWNGLLCEPAKQFHESIKKHRKSTLINKAIYNVSGQKLNFIESTDSGELSGLAGFGATNEIRDSDQRTYEVSTITFNELSDEYIPGKNIDFLSVDTEGSEYEILSSIDYKKNNISVITVEHNYEKDKLEKIRTLLTQNNFYEFAPGVFKWDSVFINKNLESGYENYIS